MTDDLVAYLLDDLCPERRAEIERRLETDVEWQREFARLQECFAGDGDSTTCGCEPPQDLVNKTCCLVDRARHSRPQPSPTAAAAACDCGRSTWSLVDVTVGAGVVAVLGMLILPAVRESRDATRRYVCQDNLRALGTALYEFQENHNHQLPAVAPGQNAGRFAVDIADRVGVDRRQLSQWLLCPDSELAERQVAGATAIRIPSQDELDAARGRRLARLLAMMAGSYAYRVGYYDPRDNSYHLLRYTGNDREPMLADAPRVSNLGVRSGNHGGCGQYVLYQDLRVSYRANGDLAASVDNIFLNEIGQHAAGRNQRDVVLIRGEYGPDGPIVPLGAAR